MYEKGSVNYLDLFLQSESLSQLLNRAESIVSRFRNMTDKRWTNIFSIKEGIAKREAQLQAEHEELLVLQQGTEQKHQSVEQLLSAKSAELQKYENQITVAQDQISEYEKDLKAQEDKIRQMEAEIKRKEEEAKKAAEAAGKQYNTPSIGNIKFISPVSCQQTDHFQFRRQKNAPKTGGFQQPSGNGYWCSHRNRYRCCRSGRGYISTYSYSAGNYLMINHGGGVYTVYMHCSQLLASAGETVSQGQVIAKVGLTGVSTGPHYILESVSTEVMSIRQGM